MKTFLTGMDKNSVGITFINCFYKAAGELFFIFRNSKRETAQPIGNPVSFSLLIFMPAPAYNIILKKSFIFSFNNLHSLTSSQHPP